MIGLQGMIRDKYLSQSLIDNVIPEIEDVSKYFRTYSNASQSLIGNVIQMVTKRLVTFSLMPE